MISRICFASCHAWSIRSRRLGPIPSTDCSSAGGFSMTTRTSAPNRPTSFFARIGPIPFTKPLPRYRSIPSAVVGGTVFMIVALNCSPCSLSLTHQPSAASHSPAVTDGRRSHDRHLFSLPCDFYPEDTEAALVVMEGDALDQPRDFLGRGFALWDSGVHLGIHFPTDGLPWVTLRKPIPQRFCCPEGFEAAGAFPRRWRAL